LRHSDLARRRCRDERHREATVETHWTTPIPLSSCAAPFFVALALSILAACGDKIVTLHHEARCILAAVANHMGVALRSDSPPPAVRYSSTTPLSEFRIAVQAVSRVRPNAVCNTYLAGPNVIFLTDDPAYYQQGRTLDDSLAHEYTHFIQDRYGGGAAREDDDQKEKEAARVQFWFRDTFMSDPPRARTPCITGPRFPPP
jgi:hypothetical protein